MGWGSFFKSLGTGGISDIFSKQPAFSGALESSGAPDWLKEVAYMGSQIADPVTNRAVPSIIGAADNTTNWGTAFDQGVDLPVIGGYKKAMQQKGGAGQGAVDLGTRETGEQLPESVRAIAPAAGAVVGSVIYPVAGTAAGYGVGAKLQGQPTEEAEKGAAISAALSYLAGSMGGGGDAANAGADAAGTGAEAARSGAASSIAESLAKQVALNVAGGAARTGVNAAFPQDEPPGWAGNYAAGYNPAPDPDVGAVQTRMPSSFIRRVANRSAESGTNPRWGRA